MEVVIAVHFGQGWDSVFQQEGSAASTNHLEKTLVNKPQSHCSLHLARLFILLDFSERISESKDNTRKWWVFVQREVNPNALFNSIHLSRCQLL